MAQPNVSREPSMEEILASIRRIIESNEPPPALGSDSYDDRGSDLAFDRNGYEASASEMELPVPANQPGPSRLDYAARMEAATPADASSHPESEHRLNDQADRGTPRQVSLADLAARVRNANHVDDKAGQSEREVYEPARAFSPPEPAAPAPASSVTLASSPFSSPFGSPSRPLEKAAVVFPAQEEQHTSHRHPAVTNAEPAQHQQEIAHVSQEQVKTETSNLLSTQAGAQVARSFEELAAAVDGQQRRSLDEIAQDMLRPMLQEWLDDNLPTLVERLVREEIERIARGSRR
ncbi:PopZ family protein [Allorhizobium sp. BGMRC 0089]|uniref:PopZ family protein n=1 Tax=Allorhizobium sonneratiae TaxID=2934936 RepID=UPI00203371F8|nr:PopZ family protein [Allorhizobium sonneratiae]MCM2292928.1 PopZ family protein [Allorhizobium sonneratiae]